jgi:hypothetical protein
MSVPRTMDDTHRTIRPWREPLFQAGIGDKGREVYSAFTEAVPFIAQETPEDGGKIDGPLGHYSSFSSLIPASPRVTSTRRPLPALETGI